MRQFRRSEFLLFTLEHLETLPSGSGPVAAALVVTSVLSGEHLLTELNELARLQSVSSRDWTSHQDLLDSGFSQDRIEILTNLGILLVRDEPEFEVFRRVESSLSDGFWPPLAAAYHLMKDRHESRVTSVGTGVDTFNQERQANERAQLFMASHGPPPPAFFKHPGAGPIELLPPEPRLPSIAPILQARRTCRYFDEKFIIGVEEISALLKLVLGPSASRTLAGELELLMKTSPSGGSLHPIEGYPLVLRSSGLPAGLYHYRADLHGLEPIRLIDEEKIRRLATLLAQGQSFVGSCSLVLILVARFDRNFWKYRHRENSYSVVLQDAGHLSQTFQLAATDMGFGSFYTAAIHSEAISTLLALNYPSEAPLGLLGVGQMSEQVPDSGVRAYSANDQR